MTDRIATSESLQCDAKSKCHGHNRNDQMTKQSQYLSLAQQYEINVTFLNVDISHGTNRILGYKRASVRMREALNDNETR